MKKIYYFLFVALLLTSCGSKALKVSVENPSDFDRTTDMVEVAVDSLTIKVPLAENQVYAVKNEKGELVTSQVTHDGKLIFQAGVKAKANTVFTIEAGAKQPFKGQTTGRLVPERYDDFAWENDRVAFRIYGPALIKIDGPSNGLDLWYKRTSELVQDKWYKENISGNGTSYHEDHGEGLDAFETGRSLGGGAMAPYTHDTLTLNQNFVTSTLLDKGPLRTTFKLTYRDISVEGNTYKETRTFSLDAGSQLTKVIQAYDGLTAPLTVAAGFSIHNDKNTWVFAPDKTYLAYTETEGPKVQDAFLGLVFPEGIDHVATNEYKANDHGKGTAVYKHVLAVASYQPNNPITYYTGYGWKKFGFANRADFETYLDHFSKGLKHPLVVKY